MRRLVLAFALLAGAVVGTGAGGTAPAAAAGCDRQPFPPGLAEELAARYPGQHVTAAVLDGDCLYELEPALRLTTASVLKMEIMAGVLLRAQSEGRGLTQAERDRIWPMITMSTNPEASQLWSSLGGVGGMESLDGAFGLTGTDHVGPGWGLTTTSARDQVHLIRQLVLGGGPLAPAYRAEARYYLTNVVPEQRWGATASVPAGWTVAQKNGFASSPCCAWRLNTVGWVERPDGVGYAMAVLSDGWPTQAAGIAAVHELSGRINAVMARPPAWHGPLAVPGGNGVRSSPEAAAVRGSRSVHVAVRGTDGGVWLQTWNGTAWSGYRGLGAPTAGGIRGAPAVASWGPGRLDVFVRGDDDKLWQRFSTDGGATWSSWARPVGTSGTLAAGPEVVSWAPGRLDVLVLGTDGRVYQRFWDGTSWSGSWLSRGSTPGGATGEPAGAAWTPGRLDVFARGVDGRLWQSFWDGTRWSDWLQPPGTAAGSLAAPADGDGAVLDAASWAPGHVAVAVTGTDGRVWLANYAGGASWSGWAQPVPSATIRGGPTLASRGLTQLDLFTRAANDEAAQLYLGW